MVGVAVREDVLRIMEEFALMFCPENEATTALM
jgi:hypothetical protein